MRLTVTLDKLTVGWLSETLMDGVLMCSDPHRAAQMKDTLKEVNQAARAFNLQERATMLYENERLVIYEHPDEGDEAPVMLLDKERGRFFEETPFWDSENPRELMEWMRAEP